MEVPFLVEKIVKFIIRNDAFPLLPVELLMKCWKGCSESNK